MKWTTAFTFLLLLCFACQKETDADWTHYLGDPATTHYSKLDRINVENISQLQVAWTYSSGDADTSNRSQIQCNPLVIDGILYGTSPQLKCFALNAATGEELWSFDPFEGNFEMFGMGVNRGLAFWKNGQEQRILYCAGSFLYALDAKTGQLFKAFGNEGKVDLHDGLGRDVSDFFVVANAPGVVYKDLLILGTRVSEATGAAPGHIRAYDVLTGEQRWIFHTIPQPGEFGYETWPSDAWQRIGGANAWAGMSLDEKRGMVFVPTGSASYDFYGGDREGDNLFANCILALDANTGKRIWHYQTVHHDIWDRDLPCPPTLVTVEHDGKPIDAVAQATKSGYIFLLNRETGESLFPVKEQPVRTSDLKGEKAAVTQPIPTKPLPFARNRIDSADLTDLTPEEHAYALDIWRKSKKGEPFIPPTLEGTLLFPGFDGGAEWGGAAFDPESKLLYVNANEMPWILQMLPYQAEAGDSPIAKGKNIYQTQCMNCHGKDLKGASIFKVPNLEGVKDRYPKEEIVKLVKNGKGVMPSFTFLSDEEIESVVAFIQEGKGISESTTDNGKDQDNDLWTYPYVMAGYKRFKTPEGYPAIKPPWGTLTAINLNNGEFAWQIPFGEHLELVAKGLPPTGCENYGGAVVTAGGVLIIAATLDEKIRAFDKTNGKLLWEAKLPAAGYATPATYSVNGKQYVVIACGGGKLNTKSGDTWVAFALPD
ncbi:MAG: PQQ-binding-like beta-propeller repeat protein [Saprospiraceae bacterium]|nr:PQQ-binding-like beta-propeller repeat protein [Saprospiraceae bacterium]